MDASKHTHRVEMTDRAKMFVQGVTHVDSFDEAEITLVTNKGMLILKGEGLHITQLNLDQGNLTVEGRFRTIDYPEDTGVKSLKGKGKGILDRLLK